MRRFWVASLSVAALIGTSTAMALGLGEIQVRSALNQPFVAQIPLLAVPTDDVDAVRVKLADGADFERMGIERADYLSNLEFKVVAGSPPRIEINASRAVREPFLTFLLDVRSATGRVLREYTVLLDPPPPIIAGRSSDAPPSPPRQVAMPPPTTRSPVPTPVVATPAPTAAPTATPTDVPTAAPTAVPTRASATPPAKTTASDAPSPPPSGTQQYTVKPRETLWGVATAVRPDADVEMNQVIYALITANPTAFDRGRFEGLMKNVTLDVPSRDAMLRTSAQDAQAAVAAMRRSGRIDGRAASAAPRQAPAATARPTATSTPTATATPTATPTVTATPSATPAPMAADDDPDDASAAAPAVDGTLPGAPAEADADADTAAGTADPSAMDDAETGLDDAGLDPDSDLDTGAEPDEAQTGGVDGVGDADDDPLAVDTEREAAEPAVSGSGADASPGVPLWPILLLLAMVGLIILLLVRRRRQASADTSGVVPPPPAAKKSPNLSPDAAVGGSAAVSAAPPASVEAAQRQADEAEALFMAAYAEEQADAERTRAQADPANLDDIPDFDAAQVIDAPADKTSSQRDPVESDFNDDFDAGLDPERGWAKADALLSELDAPTPTPTPELPDIPVDSTPAAATDDDPLAQADAHMSFGLYDDALDALDTALEGDPYRAEWLVKRAEVLLDAGRVRAFIAAAKDAKPHVNDAQWQALVEAGRRVAPDAPLFAADAVAPDAADAPPPAAPPPDDLGLDFNLDDLPSPDPSDVLQAPGATPSAPENLIDFDLKFDAPELGAAPATPPPAEDGDHGVDFDLSGFDDAPPPAAQTIPSQTPEPGAAPATPPPAEDGDPGVDFDLSGFDDAPPPAVPTTPSQAAEPSPAIDELDALDDFKLDDFALDKELTPETDAEADSDSLGTGDEAATKLDLARAYVDMGDAEMARALLGEVLVEGNDTQQDEARSLMSRLG